MPNLTVSIPEDVQERMKEHTEIRWSEVVRLAIEKKIADLELLERLTKKSRLAEKDVKEISAKIDREVSKKLGLG
jgi:predicted CopG family antitoxin